MNVFSCYSPLTVISCVSDLLLKYSVGVERLPLLQLPEYKIFEVLIMPSNHFSILKSFLSPSQHHNPQLCLPKLSSRVVHTGFCCCLSGSLVHSNSGKERRKGKLWSFNTKGGGWFWIFTFLILSAI